MRKQFILYCGGFDAQKLENLSARKALVLFLEEVPWMFKASDIPGQIEPHELEGRHRISLSLEKTTLAELRYWAKVHDAQFANIMRWLARLFIQQEM